MDNNANKREPELKSEPRYELVFALDNQTTEALAATASQNSPTSGTSQKIRECYYETLDCGRQTGSKRAGRSQYRVRQINNGNESSLEKLSWNADAYTLRQTAVTASELPVHSSSQTKQTRAGKWFYKRLAKHNLSASLQMQMNRTTWTCESTGSLSRLTVDQNIQAASLQPGAKTINVNFPCNIVRINFADSMPASFKALVYQFALLPERHSIMLDLARTLTAQQEQTAAATPTPHPQQEAVACQLG